MTGHTLQDKTVLIAGGAKNLGGLIARDLAEQGARAVVIHYNSAASRMRTPRWRRSNKPAPGASPCRPT